MARVAIMRGELVERQIGAQPQSDRAVVRMRTLSAKLSLQAFAIVPVSTRMFALPLLVKMVNNNLKASTS